MELVLAKSEYKRDLDFVKYYLKDASTYISKMHDLPEEEAMALVKEVISPTGAHPFFNPRVLYLDSTKPGFRTEVESTMLDYMRSVSDRNYIMAATFTCYTHPDELQSPTAEYIIGEIQNRTRNKSLQLAAEQAGNFKEARIHENRQNRNKIKVNSVSGGHNTKSSALFQRTAHSTLTSTCRSGTSNTNANLEKFLTGNRHYFDVDCALQNIISICNITDLDLVQQAMDKYNLVYPTVNDLAVHIKRSTDLYWNSAEYTREIRNLLNKLSPLERAAVMYVSDMYALKVLNEEFVRGFFTNLHAPDTETVVDDPLHWIYRMSGDDKALLGIMANDHIKHRSLKKESIEIMAGEPETIKVLGATSKRIIETMEDLELLAKAFWTTRNMPVSVARFPTSIRRCVMASDTDSAIFTVQDWVNWFVGEIRFDQEASAVAAVTTYLCSLVTTHLLMNMMGNFGTAERHLAEYQMKNEYYFQFFALTTMAKHYFASMAAKEGVVYKSPKWEIKGAQLKDTNAPLEFSQRAEDMIREIGTTIMSGGKIDLQAYLEELAAREKQLFADIETGSINFFSRARIKPKESYSETATHSPYDQYILWQEVFAPKYGDVSAPPYSAIRVKIEVESPSQFDNWIASIEDRQLAERLHVWMVKNNKKRLTSLCLPVEIVSLKGIPKEISDLMNTRGMVMKNMRTFYLLLETMGVFLLNDNNTKMLSDQLS